MIFNFVSTNNNSRVLLILPVSVCVCLRLLTLKASSVWISWNPKEQINDVVLKTFLSSAKSLHRYFRMSTKINNISLMKYIYQ